MPNNQIPAIVNRRSIRSYMDKPVDQETIRKILLSAMYAPSARNIKKWQFVVVDDKEQIRNLSEMKPHSSHVAHAPLVIVVCSVDWQYWLEDASIVSSHILLETENQGLGACWTQVRDSSTYTDKTSENYVKNILNIPEEIKVLCMISIGYPLEEKNPHTESEFKEKKIHKNTW